MQSFRNTDSIELAQWIQIGLVVRLQIPLICASESQHDNQERKRGSDLANNRHVAL